MSNITVAPTDGEMDIIQTGLKVLRLSGRESDEYKLANSMVNKLAALDVNAEYFWFVTNNTVKIYTGNKDEK